MLNQIKQYAGDKITIAYDTITVAPTSADTYEVMSKTRPSQMLTSLPIASPLLGKNNHLVHIEIPLAYLALEEIRILGGELRSPLGLVNAAANSVARVNTILAENPNIIRQGPIRVLPRGYESLDEGLDLSRTGKVS